MNKSDLTKKLTDIYIESEGNFFDKTADWIEANFTPKGEAEKVTAKECYRDFLQNTLLDPRRGTSLFNQLAANAHRAAKAFNEYKPQDND